MNPAILAVAFALAPGLALAAGTPVYDVTAFGAKGDGRTLDTAAINKAVETAAGAGGGTVYFPAGTSSSRTSRCAT